MTHTITFKTKPFNLIEADGSKSLAIRLKKSLVKADCSMRPIDHTYYNSDFFVGMLNKAYRKIVGETRSFIRLNSLPERVQVDTTGFLATVTIQLPEEFK